MILRVEDDLDVPTSHHRTPRIPPGAARRSARREAVTPFKGDGDGGIIARMLQDGGEGQGAGTVVTHSETSHRHTLRQTPTLADAAALTCRN